MATFTVRGKNMEVTPALREYVEKRVGKVQRVVANGFRRPKRASLKTCSRKPQG